MLHVVQEDENAAVASHLVDFLGERSIEDTALAQRGIWLRVASGILDCGTVGTMLATCLPVISARLPRMIENLPVQLLAPNTQVRRN